MLIFVCRLVDAFDKDVGGVSVAQHPAIVTLGHLPK
jgi:hypothetical protein